MVLQIIKHFYRDSKSWRASKSLYWFKSYGDFAEWVDFTYWWSCIGKGMPCSLRSRLVLTCFYLFWSILIHFHLFSLIFTLFTRFNHGWPCLAVLTCFELFWHIVTGFYLFLPKKNYQFIPVLTTFNQYQPISTILPSLRFFTHFQPFSLIFNHFHLFTLLYPHFQLLFSLFFTHLHWFH